MKSDWEAWCAQQAAAFAADRQRGAAQLGRRVLRRLAEAARRCPADTPAALRAELEALARHWAGLRPSMAAPAMLAETWCARLAELPALDPHAWRRAAARAAGELLDAARAASAAAARHAAAALPDGPLFTLSYSSTVLAALRLRAPGPLLIAESRPRCEGRRSAVAAARAGHAVELITDAQIGLFVPRVRAVVLGADGLSAEGAAVNKAGSRLAALAARAARVPVFVLAESFKRGARPAADWPLEEMDGAELAPPRHPRIRARNFYFEVVEPALIDRWIDERGVHRRPPPLAPFSAAAAAADGTGAGRGA
ncbi:MAG: hypothetical protein KatS3mg121_0642 [Gammaproteobacteria bacterium]|nr:MAG: hypothetical protein KatS3mg121_0642 [Gammaproteobacteria bacterium]